MCFTDTFYLLNKIIKFLAWILPEYLKLESQRGSLAVSPVHENLLQGPADHGRAHLESGEEVSELGRGGTAGSVRTAGSLIG